MGEGRELNQYELANKYVGSLVWNRDSSYIAFGTQTFTAKSSTINLIDSNDGMSTISFQTNDEAIYGIDWSPDDNLIASYSSDGFVRIWDVLTATQLQSFLATMRYPIDVSFSPYGGRLAYGGSISSDNTVSTTPLTNGAVQIVVPAPSLERLQAIVELCNAPAAVEQALITSIQANQLTDFVAQVEALPEATIPPACAADLIAVAEALQNL